MHLQKYFWATWGGSLKKVLGMFNLNAFKDVSLKSNDFCDF